MIFNPAAMVFKKKPFCILFPCLLLFISCAPLKTRTPEEPVYPASPVEVLEKLVSPNYLRGAFKAIARVRVIAEGKKYPLKIAILLQLPSSMRIETIPLIGPPDFYLSLNLETLKIFLPDKGEFYLGRPSQENLALFLPFHLASADLPSILLGIPPVQDLKYRAVESWEKDGKARLDIFTEDKKVQSLLIDARRGRLREIEFFDPDGTSSRTVSYEKYGKVGGIDLPEHITLFSRKDDSQIDISYSGREIAKEVVPASFDLPLPENVRPIIMD